MGNYLRDQTSRERREQGAKCHEQSHSSGGRSGKITSRILCDSVGYQILEVEDGERGVTAAGRNRPDLILMDIQMPTLDGYEATRRANPLLRAIPNVVTSYALSGDEDKARDEYIAKPFSTRQLLAKVNEDLR
jgi:two-component system, cell cycle response regulator DivK